MPRESYANNNNRLQFILLSYSIMHFSFKSWTYVRCWITLDSIIILEGIPVNSSAAEIRQDFPDLKHKCISRNYPIGIAIINYLFKVHAVPLNIFAFAICFVLQFLNSNWMDPDFLITLHLNCRQVNNSNNLSALHYYLHTLYTPPPNVAA